MPSSSKRKAIEPTTTTPPPTDHEDHPRKRLRSTSSKSPIQTLPTELIEIILTFTSPAAVRTLRTTCKTLELKSLQHFAATQFTSTRAIVYEPSLTRLLSIARSPNFAPHVQTLYIYCDYIYDLVTVALRPKNFPRAMKGLSKANISAYRRHVDAYNAFIAAGRHIELLTSALSNLPKCSTIHLCDSLSDAKQQHTYLARHEIEEQIGMPLADTVPYQDPYLDTDPTDRLSWLLNLILSASASADLPLRKLSVEFWTRDAGLKIEALSLWRNPSLHPILANLHTLRLHLDPPRFGDEAFLPKCTDLLRFFQSTWRVQELCLSFHSEDNDGDLTGWMEYFSCPDISYLPRLEKLHVRGVPYDYFLYGEPFLAFLGKFESTLQELELREIRLGEPRVWVGILRDLAGLGCEVSVEQGGRGERRRWEMLRRLGVRDVGGVDRELVRRLGEGEGEGGEEFTEKVVEFEGEGLGEWLRGVVGKLEVRSLGEKYLT
ncbi:hypothetical protein K402DRAFT_405713 [Aulographum hederae CBS 113979]|uniref:F-box domain-containing protein n=1 Tax=Aulographum hederae CBS 113979 TaxID=1176131 RepID=A0A6G1GVZ0_9PEZI|nr:hypothetical protein K402DRAFT_405713 [Aulographum hederae CBS 113979]